MGMGMNPMMGGGMNGMGGMGMQMTGGSHFDPRLSPGIEGNAKIGPGPGSHPYSSSNSPAPGPPHPPAMNSTDDAPNMHTQ